MLTFRVINSKIYINKITTKNSSTSISVVMITYNIYCVGYDVLILLAPLI